MKPMSLSDISQLFSNANQERIACLCFRTRGGAAVYAHVRDLASHWGIPHCRAETVQGLQRWISGLSHCPRDVQVTPIGITGKDVSLTLATDQSHLMEFKWWGEALHLECLRVLLEADAKGGSWFLESG